MRQEAKVIAYAIWENLERVSRRYSYFLMPLRATGDRRRAVFDTGANRRLRVSPLMTRRRIRGDKRIIRQLSPATCVHACVHACMRGDERIDLRRTIKRDGGISTTRPPACGGVLWSSPPLRPDDAARGRDS